MTAAPQTTPIAEADATAAGQLVPALRNAFAAALVAFGLAFPIISYHAEANINNELVLTGRWPLSFGLAGDRLCVRVPAPDGERRLARLVRPRRRGRGRRHGRRARPGGARGRRRRAALAGAGLVLAHCRPVHARPRHSVSLDHARHARARRLAEVDQQLRRPDHDLRDAGLGPEHRGRPRRPARSGLCRLLRHRRLFLCAAVDDLRPVVLDLPAARGHTRRNVGRSSSASPCCGCAATISPS